MDTHHPDEKRKRRTYLEVTKILHHLLYCLLYGHLAVWGQTYASLIELQFPYAERYSKQIPSCILYSQRLWFFRVLDRGTRFPLRKNKLHLTWIGKPMINRAERCTFFRFVQSPVIKAYLLVSKSSTLKWCEWRSIYIDSFFCRGRCYVIFSPSYYYAQFTYFPRRLGSDRS